MQPVSDPPNPWPQIAGYTILEQLYAGSRTRVYRARENLRQRLVILKLLQQDYPSFNDLLQFRNQYTITKPLNIPGIVHPYSLESWGNSYALVMEDFGGISLRHYTQEHSLSLEEILAIAVQLADTLHNLHQARVIHKDIKPANILIHPTSQQVKLIDFSIASLLPKETQEIKNPQGLEGTLAYLAPEQTGRMNRGIDYRADFYALGVTLFQLCADRLPFESSDPMELVHCHLAKTPDRLDCLRPELSIVLSEIVAKLMAKNAEDRYQSAWGLKQDLENCLTQLQATGEIQPFAIGQRDFSDRFLIPEKLYGRQTEVDQLLAAFERVSQGTTELILVAGFSGIGKTAVVNEIHKPIVKQRGYFIKGKFDQFQRNVPFSAFVQAFRDLMGQLLSEPDAQMEAWKTKILAALGDNSQVMIDVIPELVLILGSQPPAVELSGTAAQNRFNVLFQKFFRVFTTQEHPLVLFIDDLQWVDSASLNLMQLLMRDPETKYLLFLGAYRDNEVSPAHPFMLMLGELQKSQVRINRINLLPLSCQSMNHLVADTLSCSLELAMPLTELVMSKAKGNPFFSTQLLKSLYEDGLIRFDRPKSHWLWDMTAEMKSTLPEDVVEFMAQQLQKLPLSTQEALKLAACIGAEFDLATLAIVAKQPLMDIATALWAALQEGLILPTSQIYKFFQDGELSETETAVNSSYRFLHDRVQQAAYSLIPEAQKTTIHYHMGQLLLTHFSSAAQKERIFEIVGHLNQGSPLVVHAAERLDLARLNLMAATKAISSTAYSAALDYLNQGIDLLPDDAWSQHYRFTLELHHNRLEAAYLNTRFEDLETWSELVLQQATSLLDRIKVYETRMMALRSQGRFLEVVQTGLEVLKLLGIEFPTQPTPADIDTAYGQSRQAWQGRSPLSLLDLPVMQDLQLMAAIQIMSKVVPSAHIAAPTLLPLLIFKQIELSIEYGNSPISIFSYADYGLVLCGIIGDISTGYEFGQLSLALLEKLQVTAFKSRAYFIVNSFIRHWKEPLEHSIPSLLAGYQSGLETGDWECVALNLLTYSHYQYWNGKELKGLAEEMAIYRQMINQVKQEATLKSHEVYLQAVINLLGKSEVPYRLQGEFFDAEHSLPLIEAANDWVGLFHIYLNQALLCYWFEQDQLAAQYATYVEKYNSSSVGFFLMPIWIFYDALIQLRCYPSALLDQQALILERITSHQKKLQNWALHAPFNHQHRWQLVAAEQHRVLHQRAEAIDSYELAIAGAKENGYLQEEALANELAAKFYLDWGKEKVAAGYMQEAYYAYARWGAKAKVNDLEARYPQLLQPILQGSHPTSFSVLETFTILHRDSSTPSSGSSISDAMDFAAILKAAQALSGTIHLNQLLTQFTEIILQNSGADKCVLVLSQDNTWLVKAISTTQGTTLCSDPLDGHPDLPVKLIQYIKRTQSLLVIDNLATHLPVIGDYLSQRQPKSLLGLPILNQGQLVGILYLENQSTAGVFTSDRTTIIEFLCAQAAISLENAELYQKSQRYNQQLQQSLSDLQKSQENLQQAQLKMIQSEKMSALGNLVAGIAHEINNPLSFLGNNIKPALNYINDVFGLLDLYQQEYPQPNELLINEAEAIDFDYIRQDLPKLIGSMDEGVKRIRDISTSLRTFSRADTDYPVACNIHDGLESTLLILKHRLKANEFRPEIQVIKDYGQLPFIDCYAGQLNQVFMNLVANAIDMFDEIAQGVSFADLKETSQKITIQTQVIPNQNSVEIRIRDNGKGMSEEVRSKIFDHLFTTKGVGKGTGLGLAIARQIITEKHGGSLTVESEVGQGSEFCLRLPISV